MSAWDLSPRVIIWVPSGSALGHPYNYTHQQIPCTDVTMLQLLHIVKSLVKHGHTLVACGSKQTFHAKLAQHTIKQNNLIFCS